VSEQNLQSECGSLGHALKLARVKPSGREYNLTESTLLLDWAAVARKLKTIPTVAEYETNGRFTNSPFNSRYQRWTLVPTAFRKFTESQWRDVLAMVARYEAEHFRSNARGARKDPLLRDRPVYGRPIQVPELAHEPVNEAGVIFAFGMLAHRLGFVVHRMQTEFPDCEAMREMAKGRWQRVRIEFEFESRNFLKHRHRQDRCDLIVCWVHNWKACPPSIDVLELRRVITLARPSPSDSQN
jgi:hypothetical protein